MKKLLVALLCIIMIVGVLSACGDNTADSTKDSTQGSVNDSKDSTNDSIKTEDSTGKDSTPDSSDGAKPGDGSTPDSEGGASKPTDVAKKDKYNYDMSEYVTLPAYKEHLVEIELDAIQQAIDSYLMQYAKDYQAKKGDRVELVINAYDDNDNKIEDISSDSFVIDRLCYKKDGAYQLSSMLEQHLVDLKIGQKYSINITLPKDFYNEEYRGESVYLEMTIKSTNCKVGDVVNVAYVGYLLDENGEIKVEDGEQKIFDSSTNAQFFLGSHLAIEEFEAGIAGMAINQTKDIYATFPSDYHAQELAGQRVLFRVTLKGIYTAPIYNNEFVRAYLHYSTVADFEESVKNEYVLSRLYDYIFENAEIKSYPQKEYDEHAKQLKDVEESFEKTNGISLDEYLLIEYNMTREQYIKSNMKREMIYYAIADIESGVRITNAMLESEREELIAYYKDYYTNKDYTEKEAIQKAEALVDDLGIAYLYENVMYDLIDEVLIFFADKVEKAKTYTSISEILKEQGELTEGNEVGNLLPGYSLESFDGTGMLGVAIDPTQNLGKITIINFWGTWCDPCKKELPYFEQIATNYKDVLSVYAIHSTQGSSKAVGYVLENYNISNMIFLMDVLKDSSDQYSGDVYFDMAGGTSFYPYTVILDEAGKVAYKHSGAMTYEQLENIIISLGVEKVQ